MARGQRQRSCAKDSERPKNAQCGRFTAVAKALRLRVCYCFVLQMEARVKAIVGSIAGSKASAVSGMRAWAAFHSKCLRRTGPPFPPLLDDLLCWSTLFRHVYCKALLGVLPGDFVRHPRTFSNYLSYVKVACELVGVSLAVFGHPSLRRAKIAIGARVQPACGSACAHGYCGRQAGAVCATSANVRAHEHGAGDVAHVAGAARGEAHADALSGGVHLLATGTVGSPADGRP